MTTEFRNAPNIPGWSPFLDISSVQRVTDAKAIKAAGYDAVVVKVSEGQTWCDPREDEHVLRLQDAGILVAHYAFCRMGTDPVKAAQSALACGAVPPGFMAIDMETAPASFTDVQIVDWILAFREESQRHLVDCILYTGWSFAQERFNELDHDRYRRLGELFLWVARYKSTTRAFEITGPELATLELQAPNPWTTFDAIQYSGDGGYLTPGVGLADRNVARGSREDLARLFGAYLPRW